MLRFNLNQLVTSTGELGIYDISDEISCRFVIENADSGNEFEISGRITGQNSWVSLGSLSGSTNEIVIVETYDDIKIECTTFDSLSSYVKIIGCSFNR